MFIGSRLSAHLWVGSWVRPLRFLQDSLLTYIVVCNVHQTTIGGNYIAGFCLQWRSRKSKVTTTSWQIQLSLLLSRCSFDYLNIEGEKQVPTSVGKYQRGYHLNPLGPLVSFVFSKVHSSIRETFYRKLVIEYVHCWNMERILLTITAQNGGQSKLEFYA